MVKTDYLLHQPARISAAKRFVDQQLLPYGIDLAADLEARCEQLAARTRAAPAATLGLAFGAGLAIAFLFGQSRR